MFSLTKQSNHIIHIYSYIYLILDTTTVLAHVPLRSKDELNAVQNGTNGKIKKKLKRLSRDKLEEIVKKKVRKHLEAEAELIKVRKTCQELQKEVNQWKEKTERLADGFADLSKKVQNSSEKKVTVKTEGHKINVDKVTTEESSKKNGSADFLPPLPARVTSNDSLPVPSLKLTQTKAGLEVFWTYTSDHTMVASYELFAFRKTMNVKPPPNVTWMKVGDVQSIPLPIKVTLSSFKSGSTYTFAVRAKDAENRAGQFSDTETISLV